MATKKAAGSAKNLTDSKPKYLGVKRSQGQGVRTGEIIVRQRGTKIEAGTNVLVGKDHTLYAKTEGRVDFKTIRKENFTGKIVRKKQVHVRVV